MKIYVESGGQGADEVTIACLQGIAGGTLLYVVMFEVMLLHKITGMTWLYIVALDLIVLMSQVLNRERMKEVSGLMQLLGICIGFAVMLVIEIYGRIQTPSPL